MSKSNAESGDAVSISNFKTLIDTCIPFGADYDPSNDDLTLPNMTMQWTTVDGKEKAYLSLVQGTRMPVRDRQAVF